MIDPALVVLRSDDATLEMARADVVAPENVALVPASDGIAAEAAYRVVVVAFVATRLVVVALVAVSPVMLATDALRVPATVVVKSASEEKRSVEVAFPRVELPDAERLVVDALVTASVFVVVAYVKAEEAAKEPPLLNCTCPLLPATVEPAPPLWSGAQMTSPKASVVSLPPLPKVEQLMVERLMPASVVVPVTARSVAVAAVTERDGIVAEVAYRVVVVALVV